MGFWLAIFYGLRVKGLPAPDSNFSLSGFSKLRVLDLADALNWKVASLWAFFGDDFPFVGLLTCKANEFAALSQ